jgi:hypothetical protein
MTLKECLAAMRAEKLVALPGGGVVEGGEERNRAANTAASSGAAGISPANIGDSASDSHIYPRKPDDSCGRSEISPTSTRIYPSTPVKLVQGDIFFGDAPETEKNESHTSEVGPLGEIRVDCGVLRVDRPEGVGEIGENGPKMEARATAPSPPRRRDPHLTPGGTLVIPFDSDPKYHWWNGGQSVKQTRAEVLAKMEAQREQASATPTVTPESTGEAPVGQEFGKSSVKSGEA